MKVADRRPTHVSVLEDEVCEALRPAVAVGDGLLVDATAGLGGHADALCRSIGPKRVVLIDRDPSALALAKKRLEGAPCPVVAIHARFSTIASALAAQGIGAVSAILADVGVSSMQLDAGARGFSWREDAPLDMRMDPTVGPTAAEVLQTTDLPTLTRVLREYGEEPDAPRIAAALVAARPQTTTALADVVTAAMSARQRRRLGTRIHPATRTFMALRIHINDELGELDRLLSDAPPLLVVGGRLAVISFHSLEDRRVKRAFAERSRAPRVPAHIPLREKELPRPKFRIPRGYARGITASEAEIDDNPRSRSARLRVLERAEA